MRRVPPAAGALPHRGALAAGADAAAPPVSRRRCLASLVRRDVIARCGPNLLAVLNSVLALLGTGTLRALGARVELAGQDSRLVAGGWLSTHGLIPAGGDLR